MPHTPPLAPTSPAQAKRRQWIAGAVALVVVATIALGLKAARGSEVDPAPTTAVATTEPTAPTSEPTTSTSSTTAAPSPTTRTRPTYRSTGQYRSVVQDSPVRGRATGQLVTYRVEVEQGSGVSPRKFAQAVDTTLRHRRGWTAGGHWRFQRVTTGAPDVTIRVATPDTVDKHCEAAGASTRGYSSCRAGGYIMLNLDRWELGVPHVKSLSAYRHYLINHEMGHALGKGHERCPRKGKPAPVMVQQTHGLQGCTANAWPRSVSGRLITGPPAP